MQLGRIVSATVLAVVLGSGLADARGLEISGPMEVPPATYTGRQYVDSAGCVFVRAGYGGAVNWVARVGRDRKQLCGYKPTFGPSAPVLEVAKSAPAPAPAPVPVTAAAPRPTAVVTAPQVLVKPAPVVARPGTAIAKTQTVGRPMQTIATTTSMPTIGLAANRRLAPVVAAPAGQAPVVVADTSGSPSAYVSAYQRRNQDAPTPVAGLVIVSAQTVSGGQTACPNLSPVAQRYMLNDGRHVVRCGPQIEDPVGYINRAKVPGLQVVAVTPQVYAATYGTAPVAVQAAPAVPKGYKAAWNDRPPEPQTRGRNRCGQGTDGAALDRRGSGAAGRGSDTDAALGRDTDGCACFDQIAAQGAGRRIGCGALCAGGNLQRTCQCRGCQGTAACGRSAGGDFAFCERRAEIADRSCRTVRLAARSESRAWHRPPGGVYRRIHPLRRGGAVSAVTNGLQCNPFGIDQRRLR